MYIHIFYCHIKTKKPHQILYLASLLKEIIHPNAVKGLPCCKKWAYSVGNSTHMGGYGIMDVGKKQYEYDTRTSPSKQRVQRPCRAN